MDIAELDAMLKKENRIKELEEASLRKDYHIRQLQDELRNAKRERDAAIADLTEFAKFYRRNTICHFCDYDGEEQCPSASHKDNYYINDCFKWRGIMYEPN